MASMEHCVARDVSRQGGDARHGVSKKKTYAAKKMRLEVELAGARPVLLERLENLQPRPVSRPAPPGVGASIACIP